MAQSDVSEKRIFTYAEASALLPELRRLTEQAYERVEMLSASPTSQTQAEVEAVIDGWARELFSRGVEVKGLWLLDFDNGSGYYCWRYPETGLMYFHSYEDGFSGRVPIQ